MKTTRTAYIDLFDEPDGPKNPENWYSRGLQYHSAVTLLIKLHKDKVVDNKRITEEVANIMNAFNTIPYLTALSLELYMKGFLISHNITVKEVLGYRHQSKDLWKKCASLDNRFGLPSIRLIADQLYDHLMKDGGVRYPDKQLAPIYIEDFTEALETARGLLKKRLVIKVKKTTVK
jgi:hypothetical protein